MKGESAAADGCGVGDGGTKVEPPIGLEGSPEEGDDAGLERNDGNSASDAGGVALSAAEPRSGMSGGCAVVEGNETLGCATGEDGTDGSGGAD